MEKKSNLKEKYLCNLGKALNEEKMILQIDRFENLETVDEIEEKARDQKKKRDLVNDCYTIDNNEQKDRAGIRFDRVCFVIREKMIVSFTCCNKIKCI